MEPGIFLLAGAFGIIQAGHDEFSEILCAVTGVHAEEHERPGDVDPEKRDGDEAYGTIEGVIALVEGDGHVVGKGEFGNLENDGKKNGGKKGVFCFDVCVGEKLEEKKTSDKACEERLKVFPEAHVGVERTEKLGRLINRDGDQDGAERDEGIENENTNV